MNDMLPGFDAVPTAPKPQRKKGDYRRYTELYDDEHPMPKVGREIDYIQDPLNLCGPIRRVTVGDAWTEV